MSTSSDRLPAPGVIRSAIGRARARIRLQRALESLTAALVPASFVAFTFLLLYKMGDLRDEGLYVGLGVAGAVLAAGLLVGLVRPIPVVDAARALDGRADLHDRVGSAWEFAQAEDRTPFMEAAIRDAVARASGLRVGRFFRLVLPRSLPYAIAGLIGVGLVLSILRPGAAAVTPVTLAREARPPPIVPPFQAALAHQRVEETKKEAERIRDDEARKVLGKLDRLWKNIHDRKIDKAELWRRLASLQKQKLEGLSEPDKAELGRLKKMGEKMGKSSPMKPLSEALKKNDLQKAQEALRELARKLRDKQLTKKERKEIERALKQATKQTREQLSQMRRKLEKLQKQIKKRELQKLTREKKQRELERLSRELEKLQDQLTTQLSEELMDALRQMKRYSDQDAGRSLEKAAERMKQLMKRIRRLQLMAKAQDHIKEMKELLRRGGQQGRRDDQLRDFHVRAGSGGQGDLTLLLPGGQRGNSQKPGGPGGQPGQCQKCGGSHPTNTHGGQSGASNQPGKGIGSGTDMRLGQATDLKGQYAESKLTGKKGRGDSTSEVFYGAATKGFSRVRYRDIYSKYREVVEEALEKNKGIPHGQKRIVEKYFEMIRPR